MVMRLRKKMRDRFIVRFPPIGHQEAGGHCLPSSYHPEQGVSPLLSVSSLLLLYVSRPLHVAPTYATCGVPRRIIESYGTIVKSTTDNSKRRSVLVTEQGGACDSMISKPSPPRHGHSMRVHLPPTKVLAQVTGCRGVACWSPVHRRSALLFLLLLLLGTGAVVLLSFIDVALQQSEGRSHHTSPSPPLLVSTARATLAPSPSVTLRSGHPHLYHLPPNVGLMQPSVDAEGHVWVG